MNPASPELQQLLQLVRRVDDRQQLAELLSRYGMAVDERELPGDTFVEMHGVRLVVDRMSLPYLVGSEIDWVESLMGGGFTVHNPNAVSTCGCGHSFRTKDQEGTPRTCGH